MIAKSAGWHCNLACDYCFYLAKGQDVLRDAYGQRYMSDKAPEAYVRQYIAASSGPEVNFTWQGGEPTLAGLDFYRWTAALRQLFTGNKRITNSLQTSDVLTSDRWVTLPAQHRLLAGMSLNGSAHPYNHYRKTGSRKPVFEQAMVTLGCPKHHRVDVSILNAVNSATTQTPLGIYRFPTHEVGAESLQFIPVVEYGFQRGLLPWSVTGKDYG